MQKEQGKYVLLAAYSELLLDRRGADLEEYFETLAEAKKRARYALTEQFARNCEMSERLGYAKVVRVSDGVCLADFVI